MALDKVALKEAIIEAFSNPKTESNIETVSEKLASAIEEYVKGGIVTGTCPPNGGPLIEGKVE